MNPLEYAKKHPVPVVIGVLVIGGGLLLLMSAGSGGGGGGGNLAAFLQAQVTQAGLQAQTQQVQAQSDAAVSIAQFGYQSQEAINATWATAQTDQNTSNNATALGVAQTQATAAVYQAYAPIFGQQAQFYQGKGTGFGLNLGSFGNIGGDQPGFLPGYSADQLQAAGYSADQIAAITGIHSSH